MIMWQPIVEHLQEFETQLDISKHETSVLNHAVSKVITELADVRSDLRHTNKCLGSLRQGLGAQCEKRCVLQRDLDAMSADMGRLERQVYATLTCSQDVERRVQQIEDDACDLSEIAVVNAKDSAQVSTLAEQTAQNAKAIKALQSCFSSVCEGTCATGCVRSAKGSQSSLQLSHPPVTSRCGGLASPMHSSRKSSSRPVRRNRCSADSDAQVQMSINGESVHAACSCSSGCTQPCNAHEPRLAHSTLSDFECHGKNFEPCAKLASTCTDFSSRTASSDGSGPKYERALTAVPTPLRSAGELLLGLRSSSQTSLRSTPTSMRATRNLSAAALRKAQLPELHLQQGVPKAARAP